MNTDKLRELFNDALALEPKDRAEFLNALSECDRHEIESLLAANEEADDFLQHPIRVRRFPCVEAAKSASDPMIGQQIDRYLIQSVLAVGGMGVVYLAQQEQPSRQVALKLLRPGFATPAMLRRFRHEAELLGRLQHPGIAAIIEAGAYEEPGTEGRSVAQPWFAMEYIDGLPLIDHVASENLSVEERLALLLQVCEAVQHAHLNGVIHRDIKPANILVVQDPAQPGTKSSSTNLARAQVKILDFGVGRLLDADQRMTLATEVGQLIGTLAYMSPEQAVGRPDEIDARTDVYSIGLVMYEALAGRPPHEIDSLPLPEAARIIRDVSPPRLGSVNPACRGDIETIVHKAIEKEKSRRYQSASELGEDIRRFLNREPILARAPSTFYLLRTFARRNRTIVAGAAATFAALVIGLIGTGFGLNRAMDALAVAEEKTQIAVDLELDARRRAEQLEEVVAFQARQIAGIDVGVMGATIRRGILERRAAAWQRLGLTDEEIAGRLLEFENLLADLNFTDVAIGSLDENFFEGAIKAVESQFADDLDVQAKLFRTLATTMGMIGLLERAAQVQERVLEIHRSSEGVNHIHLYDSMIDACALFVRKGKFAEAEVRCEEAIAGLRRVGGDDHEYLVRALTTLGILRHNQGRLEEAERAYRQALDLSRRVLGEDNENAGRLLSNLGTLLHARGRHVEAEPYYREAEVRARRVLGENHPETLNALNNLGYFLQQEGRLGEAEEYYRKALESMRIVLGSEHPTTLNVMNNLSTLLQARGELEEAARFAREALDARRRMLGDEHRSTMNSLNNMGSLLRAMGRDDEALEHYVKALLVQRRVLGERHPDTVISLGNVGFLLYRMERLDEAEPYLREALSAARESLGIDHPQTQDAIGALVQILIRTEQFSEAELLQREMLEIRRRHFGEDHPRAIEAMSGLASVLRRGGNLTEAVELGEEAARAARNALPPGHWHLGVHLSILGQTLIEAGRFDQAEAALLEAQKVLAAAGAPAQRRLDELALQFTALYERWHEAVPEGGYDTFAARWRTSTVQSEPPPAVAD